MNSHVFFGGSFTPPHLGHHQLLMRLLVEPEVAKVHLVPTGVNPLKSGDNEFTPSERRQLVDAWIDTIKSEDFQGAHKLSLETFELESRKASYTNNSLRELQKQNPNCPWVLAIGADLLPQLARWKSVAELLGKVEAVWIFQRGGYTLSPQEIPTELRALCSWRLFPESLEWVASSDLRDLKLSPDALQAKLRPYLLDNVFEVLVRLLQQKKRE